MSQFTDFLTYAKDHGRTDIQAPVALKRCRECGGFHAPKCKPITRKQEAEIWKVILKKYPEA